MSAIEWNPSLSPVVSTFLLLGGGGCLYLLHHRLAARHGKKNAVILLLPKFILFLLLFLALMNPSLKSSNWNITPARIVVLQDISSSMDLRDDGSSTRSERAMRLIHELESAAPSHTKWEIHPFDTSLHEVGYSPKGKEERGTDLAAILMTLQKQSTYAGADALILVTDGGDEAVDIPKLPSLPLGILGMGTPSNTWNDIGIANVTAPAMIEEGSEFDIETEIHAYQGTLLHSKAALGALKVSLEQWKDKKWSEIQSNTVDLTSLRGATSFHLKGEGTGSIRYRVHLPELPGEMTLKNNDRTVDIQIQKRSIHVLYFTQELGTDFKYLRSELASDGGVSFTAMYRVLEDRFTIQGDRTGYKDLENGLPTDDNILKRYDCIILGSFTANLLSEPQAQALKRYVEKGGALILLGGDSSFGSGGYATSPLAPLIPWAITKNETPLTTGSFPVTLSTTAPAVGFSEGLKDALNAAGGASLDSINQPGSTRPGAISILDATISGHLQSIVAIQKYGKGQVLGIATNTLWRWAAAGHETKIFYGKFWRQAIRGLTQKMEGGTLLGIRWDREHYLPGEEASVEVRIQGSSDSGNVRLVGTLQTPDGKGEVNFAPIPGEPGVLSAKIPLPQRGDYSLRIEAYAGGQTVETYDRTLSVEPLVEEGASPETKDGYLRDLATRSKGVYASESDLAPLRDFLQNQLAARQLQVDIPLIDFWNLFFFLVLGTLILEWILRRRMNLI